MKKIIFISAFLIISIMSFAQSISGPTNVVGNTVQTYTFNSKAGGPSPIGTTCIVSVGNGRCTNTGEGVWLEEGKKSVNFKVKWDNITGKGEIIVRTLAGEYATYKVNITKDNTCSVTTINGQNITSTKNYTGCAIEIQNTNISNNATVSIAGDKYVSIKSSFSAAKGTKVSIRAGSNLKSIVSAESSDLNVPYLEQNIPNPFNSTTTISYFIPENSRYAYLQIFDYTGKIVHKIDILERGNGAIMLEREKFKANVIYLYSLIIDDRVVDSKKFYVK